MLSDPNYGAIPPDTNASFHVEVPENSIVLNAGETEMLRISRDGFWVRGVKINQDDKESEIVYNCFKEWLNWSTLNRN